MNLLSLRRDMAAIEDGRWIDHTEVPGLGDMRVKVRGARTSAARELFAAKERKVDPRDKLANGSLRPDALVRLLREALAEYNLIDIEGLTEGDKAVGVDKVREMLALPEYEPLAELIMAAVAVVDASRADRAKEIEGN